MGSVTSESDIGLLFGVTGVRFWPYAACALYVLALVARC